MLKEFKVVIWGLGTNGKNLIDVLGEEKILAIIEGNQEKIKTGFYKNIPIIDFENYKKNYRQEYIVVSPMKYQEIEKLLNKNQLNKYFIWNNSDINMEVFLEIKKNKFIADYQFEKKETYLISGVNLFSIYLYRYLLENGYTVKFITLTEKESSRLEMLTKEHIIKDYSQLDFEYNINACLIKTEKDNCEKNIRNINVLDYNKLNSKVSLKWETDLQKFRNIHSEKRVFIVATGPSLRLEDVEKLALYNEITMSMNSIYYLLKETKWRPNYYVISDGMGIRAYENYENVEKLFKGVEKIFSDNYLNFWKHDLDNSYHRFTQKQNVDELLFSDDCSKGVYSGLTVVYACLQLAVYMGFKEIYLLGCDFSFSKNFDSPNDHFYKKVEKFYTFDYDSVKKSYEKAKEFTEAHGIKIYNATRGGKLEVFERVDFDTLW